MHIENTWISIAVCTFKAEPEIFQFKMIFSSKLDFRGSVNVAAEKSNFRLWSTFITHADTCLCLHYHVHLTKYCTTNNEAQIFYCMSVLFHGFWNEFNRKYMRVRSGSPSHIITHIYFIESEQQNLAALLWLLYAFIWEPLCHMCLMYLYNLYMCVWMYVAWNECLSVSLSLNLYKAFSKGRKREELSNRQLSWTPRICEGNRTYTFSADSIQTEHIFIFAMP